MLLLALAVALSVPAFRMVRQALGLYRESINTDKKIQELSQKKEELEAYIARLGTPAAVEKEAKKRLNLKLPGEEVVVVVPEKNSPKDLKPPSFFDRIKKFLAR